MRSTPVFLLLSILVILATTTSVDALLRRKSYSTVLAYNVQFVPVLLKDQLPTVGFYRRPTRVSKQVQKVVKTNPALTSEASAPVQSLSTHARVPANWWENGNPAFKPSQTKPVPDSAISTKLVTSFN